MSYTNRKTKIGPSFAKPKKKNIFVSLFLRVDHVLQIVFLLSRMRTICASIPLFVPHALLSHVIENTVDVSLIC